MAYLVRDYDEAIDWFTRALGWTLIANDPQPEGKRWVVVGPGSGTGAHLLLARAATPEQATRVGDQAGGRVFLFLTTDDFNRDHAAMTARGVRFLESPRQEPYGKVAVFVDLYGVKWDLIEPR